jgi:predicted DNA-binding WGR domain protein
MARKGAGGGYTIRQPASMHAPESHRGSRIRIFFSGRVTIRPEFVYRWLAATFHSIRFVESLMARREFRFQDGRSDKFWAIDLEGRSFTVQFGRTGTAGQTQTKAFGSVAEAKKACEKLIVEKVKKGYQEVGTKTSASTKGRPTASADKSLDLKKVKIVGGPLILATDKEVDALEKKLGVSLPQGYRDYMKKLGEGVLGGTFVRVYGPRTIAKGLDSWRKRIKQYWFWDQGSAVMTKKRAVESVIIADTLQGDELLFHPEEPDRLLVLPRYKEKIFVAGSTLLEAVEWMCSSGKLTRRFQEREFKPFEARQA